MPLLASESFLRNQTAGDLTPRVEAVILFCLSRGLYNIDGISEMVGLKFPGETVQKRRLCSGINRALCDNTITSSSDKWNTQSVDATMMEKCSTAELNNIHKEDSETKRILAQASPAGATFSIPYADHCH